MKLTYNGPEEKKYYDKCDCRYEDKKPYDKHDCDYHQPCCEERKYAHCIQKSPCPYGILFECAEGRGTEVPITLSAVAQFTPISLGCVTIDTSCLNSPVVKFDFCSIIKYTEITNGLPVHLKFQLSKICDNAEEIQCGTWDFRARFNDPAELITTSFNFCHCECNSCPGCCTYMVKLIAAFNIGFDQVTIYNPTLSVMAKSSC